MTGKATGREPLFTGPFVALFFAALVFFIAGGIVLPVAPRFAVGPLDADAVSAGIALGAFSIASLVVRPSSVKPSEPAACSRRRPPLLGVTRTCCCSTARSARWIAFSAARPTVSTSSATSRSRTISRPLAVRSMVRMRNAIVRATSSRTR